MTDLFPNYDPTIQGHLTKAKERWANRDRNLETLIRYGKGFEFLDERLFGMRSDTGELILIIGEEKNRKTTMFINILINIMTDENLEAKPYTIIDSLESGMPPERYTDQLVSNLASRYLMETGHKPVSAGVCPVCSGSCKELRISPEFLAFFNRSQEQVKAIERAYETIMFWPLDIWGAGLDEGDTRNLGVAFGDMDSESRWVSAIRDKGAKIIAVDHAQQYRFERIDTTDYEKLIRVVSASGSVVASFKVIFFLLSQISLKSLQEARGGGKIRSSGGKKPHEEANVILSSKYPPDSGYIQYVIEGARRSGGVGIPKQVSIDDISGAIYTNAYTGD